jgi:hypothetical protein
MIWQHTEIRHSEDGVPAQAVLKGIMNICQQQNIPFNTVLVLCITMTLGGY